MPTVAMQCALCARGAEPRRGRVFPIPFGRLRICRACREVVCRRHSVRVGGGEFECLECHAGRRPAG